MTLLIRNFTKNWIDRKRLEKTADAAAGEEHIKGEIEISLVFTGEKRIRRLNKTYRGIDRVTDVLSFEGVGDDKFIDPADNVFRPGEIFICYPRAEKQAREKKHAVSVEIDILLVHGILHLLGYDHAENADFAVMSKKEKNILRKLYR